MARREGFTLVELLVVVAIISLLVTMLLPMLSRAKELARSVMCKTNLKAIGTGVWLYAHDNDNFAVPRRQEGWNSTRAKDPNYQGPRLPNGDPYPSGRVADFPDVIFLGQYTNSTSLVVDAPVGIRGFVYKSSPFHCPSDVVRTSDPARCSYGMSRGFVYIDDTYRWERRSRSNREGMFLLASVKETTRELVMLDACAHGSFHPGLLDSTGFRPFWGTTEPATTGGYYPESSRNWSKRHLGGANVLFVDGHVNGYDDVQAAHRNREVRMQLFYK